MTSEQDRCPVAIVILNPESVNRPTVQKASAVVFREAKADWAEKRMVVIHYIRVRNVKVRVRFNGGHFVATLKRENYQRLFE